MDFAKKEARKCQKQLAKLEKRRAKAVEELNWAEVRPLPQPSVPDAAPLDRATEQDAETNLRLWNLRVLMLSCTCAGSGGRPGSSEPLPKNSARQQPRSSGASRPTNHPRSHHPNPGFRVRYADRRCYSSRLTRRTRLRQDMTNKLVMHEETVRQLTVEAEAASVRLGSAPRRPLPRPAPPPMASAQTAPTFTPPSSCRRCWQLR